MDHLSMEQRMLHEKMLAFYGQLRQTVPVTAVAVLLFGTTMYGQHPLESRWWMAYMLGHTLLRGLSVRQYFLRGKKGPAEHWFSREFWFTLTLALGWGSFTLLFFHPEMVELFYTMMLYIVAVVAGSLITYAVSPLLYAMLVLACCGPLVVQLTLSIPAHPHHTYLALGFAIFMGVLLRYHQQAHETLQRAIELYLNQNLLLEEMHRSREQLRHSHEQLQQAHDRLEAVLGQTHQLATLDPLTGCCNRRTFLERLQDQVLQEACQPLTLVMLDLDHFKGVNDRYGHLFGDHVLKVVAGRIQQVLRDDDLLARYGGEEFVCMLPCTSLEEGERLAQSIRQAVAAAPVRNELLSHQLTVSVGITTYQPPENPTLTLKRADDALYQAKRAGRDQVVPAVP